MALKAEYTDKEIIELLHSADSRANNTAFKSIYGKSYNVILKLIVANSGTKEEAEDIYHDAVIVFYEKVKSNSLDLTCSITTYLYSIARNLWLKRLSKIKNINSNPHDIIDFIEIMKDNESSYDKELISRVSKIFEKLNSSCKEVLISFYFDNLPMKEIMRKMNLKSEQSAKNKKYKCLQQLKELVGKKIPLHEN